MKFIFPLLFLLLALGRPALAQTPDSVADTSWTGTLDNRLVQLLGDPLLERSQLGLCVYDLTADSLLFAHGQHQLLRPASCQKLLTAIAALDRLGGSYRFETRVCTTGATSEGGVLEGNVYFVGGFDPRFGHDDLYALCSALRRAGIDSIGGQVCLDVSMKDTTALGRGWCWDDEAVRLTPLLYGGRDRFVAALPGALAEAGIRWRGACVTKRAPGNARFVALRFHSIEQILRPMMKKSDNLCAEALFYQLGAQSGLAYPTSEYSADEVRRFIRRLGRPAGRYVVADGSGLSLYNYTTPELLVLTLRYAYEHDNIYQLLRPALPIAGRDGTLSRRMRSGTAYNNVRAKTGTLEGVSTLAGYATAPNGHLLAFAIMNQGIRRQAEGRGFQDRVCQILTHP